MSISLKCLIAFHTSIICYNVIFCFEIILKSKFELKFGIISFLLGIFLGNKSLAIDLSICSPRFSHHILLFCVVVDSIERKFFDSFTEPFRGCVIYSNMLMTLIRQNVIYSNMHIICNNMFICERQCEFLCKNFRVCNKIVSKVRDVGTRDTPIIIVTAKKQQIIPKTISQVMVLIESGLCKCHLSIYHANLASPSS